MPRGRIMGIDYGEKRVGVAISDELQLAAHPLATVDSKPESALLARLAEIVEAQSVVEIVVGLPLSLSGERGVAAARVERFVKKLSERVRVPVETFDERMTTKIAERSMREANLSSRKARRVVDKAAAALILDDYMRFVFNRKRQGR